LKIVSTTARRLTALLFIAAILLAAMGATGVATLPELLTPLWCCLYFVAVFLVRCDADAPPLLSPPFLPVVAPRPPPAA
jgi:hypothetical protein